MGATQTTRHIQNATLPSFESVWAAIQEITERQNETDRILMEIRKSVAERQKEADRNLIESRESAAKRQEEYECQMKNSRENFYLSLGKVTNLFGEFIESELPPIMLEEFTRLGFDFLKTNRNTSIKDKVNHIILDIDVMLENYEKAMLVEVQNNLTVERVNKHIERLEKMRRYADLHGDKRVFLGAVAAAVVTDEALNYALDQGFYIIEPTGENLIITPPNGKPREW